MLGAPISETLGEGNGLSNTLSQKRQLSSILMDLEILDCPICFEALTIPIFQCDNGHLLCASCCLKLSYYCPSCALPIGDKRCRAMESVLESILIPCPNAKLGCTMNVSYVNESAHKKECNFSLCLCPVQCCNYTGSYSDMYSHFIGDHPKKYMMLYFDVLCKFRVNISNKIVIRLAYEMSLMFAVQCFREPCGVYVTVSCIAPSSPEVGQFAYHLSYTVDGQIITYESLEMKRILEVSFQKPQENLMLIPNSLLRGDFLEMKLYIKKLKQV